jgi:hypothetical protein
VLWLDHAIYGVHDLDLAAKRFEDDYGLHAIGGGVHPGGTKNMAVPCADGSYIELLTVNEPDGPLARWVARQIADGDRFIGWAVRTDDIDGVVARLGVSTQPGSIVHDDGAEGTWTIGGMEVMGREPNLPFFIDYGVLDRRPAPDDSPRALAWVEVGGDGARLEEWLGYAPLDVRVAAGESRLRAVGLTMADGSELTIRP